MDETSLHNVTLTCSKKQSKVLCKQQGITRWHRSLFL